MNILILMHFADIVDMLIEYTLSTLVAWKFRPKYFYSLRNISSWVRGGVVFQPRLGHQDPVAAEQQLRVGERGPRHQVPPQALQQVHLLLQAGPGQSHGEYHHYYSLRTSAGRGTYSI